MQLRALDLFSGCGGSSAGARRAGATIVAAVDAWKLATAVYKDNFPGTKVVTKRLDKVPIRAFHKAIGEIDLLLASPECTNHTLAKGGAPRSEASRETAFQVLRFAREFKPRWVVVENVIQMRRWRRYKYFMSYMKTMGYNVREQILNAKNFGVAQDRKRLFILCDREQKPLKIGATSRGRPKVVRTILDRPGSWKSSQLLADNRADSTIARYCNGLNHLGDKKSFLLVYYGTDAGGGWQHLDRPLRTITTVDRFALVTPNGGDPRMRMLQVSELKRAMGFDLKYRIKEGTRRDQIKLLGNAVCPPVMASVVRTLLRGERAKVKKRR